MCGFIHNGTFPLEKVDESEHLNFASKCPDINLLEAVTVPVKTSPCYTYLFLLRWCVLPLPPLIRAQKELPSTLHGSWIQ